ncbi:MAG: tryptophan 7-halogenase [Bdellovibrionales bacterium]|nr:tryptophan 7-halogenase [Bdellovibrionales bacterium]
MKKINDHINNAFDLSYLDSTGFPDTRFNTVGILGGGTAGYLTALALRRAHPKLQITIIESSKIPVIGVGESTTTEIVPFLHHFLGLDPIEFFQEVKPTLKFGIEFDWGYPGDYKFNFNFFAAHHLESYYYEGDIKNSSWPSVLIHNKKIPIIRDASGEMASFLTSIPFSYHIDNKNLIQYLHKKVMSAGISILDTEVKNIHLDDNKFVSSLSSDDHKNIKFDFYIDCSGFRSKILGNALKTPFISYESTLITDKALTFDMPNNQNIDPFTSVITMNNGWCWKIPMRTEDHYGYVFSSKFCSEEEALEEVQKKFGKIKSHKIINFRSGRHELAWNKNVFSVGNAYAFIEPLESTAIQTVIQTIMTLCKLMPNSTNDISSITGINKEIAASWDTFRSFIGVHYKFNKKLDTEFWKWCRDNTEIGDAAEIIKLFNERPPLSKTNFGSAEGFTAHEPLVFNSNSYDTILFGQKEVHTKLPMPLMTKEDYFSKCESYKFLSDAAITQQELFADEEMAIEEVFIPLFSDQDSWIVET